jgi:hypothetical protein
MQANNNMQNMPSYFYCENCDYECSKKSSWSQHLMTLKHQKANDVLMQANEKYACDNCGVNFKHKSSFCRHKKKCKETIKFDDEISNKDLIIMLLKQNSQLIEQNVELTKNGIMNTNNSHNTNTNSHNKTFNLQFFLNETCKDAMNIMDFVNSIQLQLSDLESVGKLGFVEGISNIIATNLKALDVTQRPVHCTDNKRETIYVKDENKWEKEDEQKNKIRKAIKKIATKNLCLISKFKEAHPDCNRSSSKYADQYNKIVIEACGGSGNNDLEKEDKIIRNIAKNVTIDKKERIEK